MGNVPWDVMRWDRHKLLWVGMGMGQINMGHGQTCEFGKASSNPASTPKVYFFSEREVSLREEGLQAWPCFKDHGCMF